MIVSKHNSLCSTTALATLGCGEYFFTYISSRRYLYLSTCTGNLLAIVVGLSFGWSSPFLPKLKYDEHLYFNPLGHLITDEEASWIGSLLLCGGIFGTLITGFFAAGIGRKGTMLLVSSVPFLVSNVILAYATNIYLFYTARFIAGIGVSSVFTVVPIYLAEISEGKIRGMICSSIMTFETLGELIVYCVGPYVTIFIFPVVAFGITFLVILIILLLLPESPIYLLSIKKREAAEGCLMKLRSSTKEEVKAELDFMQAVLQETETSRSTIGNLCESKATRRAEVIAIGLTMSQHFSGVIPIILYSQDIFNLTGSSIPPEFCTMVLGAVQFLASLFAPSLVDKLGRRCMLLISAGGMMSAQLAIGLYFFRKDRGMTISHLFWLPLASLIFFIISYLAGYGPLIWTIMDEIFPIHLKAAAVTVSFGVWWLMAFVAGRIFYPVADAIGLAGCFWMFAGLSCVGAVFICIEVVETKGKTMDEIQDLLNK